MTPEERLRRAESAKRLMGDPFIQGAFAELERVVKEQFMELSAAQVDAFRDLVHIRNLTQRFKSVFELAISQGTLTRHDLERPGIL